jgi:oligogalacturonide lyase
MAIGQVTQVSFERSRDQTTGVEVTRVTDDQGDSIFPYFHQAVFTDDGAGLLISSNRSGSWQLYLLGLESGELRQLSAEEGGISQHHATILPTRGLAVFTTGTVVKQVSLDGSGTRVLYSAPPGLRIRNLAPSTDGSSVTFAYQEVLALSTETGVIYSHFNEQIYRRPSCVIMRIDTDTGGAAALWGEREWISHVNVSPVDSDVVLFCHEGPWQLVQRMWVLRASTGQVSPLVEQRRLLETSGHEFFTRSGRVVTQYGWRFHPKARTWVQFDVFVNPDGRSPEAFRYLWGSPNHVQVAGDETRGVGDGAFPTEGFAEGSSYISLIRYRDERAIVTPLCRHDSSWKTQHSHPHPVFSQDDRFVYFNTDRGGRSNVYRAPVVS